MKKRVKKVLWGSLATVVVLGGLAAMMIVRMMGQPLYQFGAVRAGERLRGPLQPPEQVEPLTWQVEPDIRLGFEAYGQGTPVLVIHGGPGIPYASPWKGLESLTDRYRFYYYHQRGCGDSTRPFDRFDSGSFYQNMIELEKTLGLGAQIADIERIRRILGHDQIMLVGHSFGGFLASLYAAEFPEHVEKLILVAPAGVLTPPDEERNLFTQARQRLPMEQRAAYDSLVEEYFDFGNIFSKSDAELAQLHRRLGPYLLEAMGGSPTELKNEAAVGGWMVFAMYLSMGTAHDYTPAMESIVAPTLIVHGEEDAISLAGSRSYERWIPGAEFQTLEREEEERPAGHFLFEECPNQFAAVVEAFLER